MLTMMMTMGPHFRQSFMFSRNVSFSACVASFVNLIFYFELYKLHHRAVWSRNFFALSIIFGNLVWLFINTSGCLWFFLIFDIDDLIKKFNLMLLWFLTFVFNLQEGLTLVNESINNHYDSLPKQKVYHLSRKWVWWHLLQEIRFCGIHFGKVQNDEQKYDQLYQHDLQVVFSSGFLNLQRRVELLHKSVLHNYSFKNTSCFGRQIH